MSAQSGLRRCNDAPKRAAPPAVVSPLMLSFYEAHRALASGEIRRQ